MSDKKKNQIICAVVLLATLVALSFSGHEDMYAAQYIDKEQIREHVIQVVKQQEIEVIAEMNSRIPK